jgi:hypothetical protein
VSLRNVDGKVGMRPEPDETCPVSATSGSNHAHHDEVARAVDAAGLDH